VDFFSISTPQLKRLPYKQISDVVNKSFTTFVEKKIENRKLCKDTSSLENVIDVMIYRLYELTYDKVKVVDPEVGELIGKNEYEKFSLISASS